MDGEGNVRARSPRQQKYVYVAERLAGPAFLAKQSQHINMFRHCHLLGSDVVLNQNFLIQSVSVVLLLDAQAEKFARQTSVLHIKGLQARKQSVDHGTVYGGGEAMINIYCHDGDVVCLALVVQA
jgi:hypothetical protein